MEILIEILFIILAYLIGSIPNALIIGKLFFKTDVREHGSKNMGATNSLRVLGPTAGFVVFFLDMLKGFILIALFKFGVFDKGLLPHIPIIFLGLFTVLGHIFPIFAKFKGGKGVAATSGIILAYAPWCFLIGLCVFLLTVIITKYVSLGSILTIFSMFICSFFINPLYETSPNIYFSIFCFILTITLIVDHRKNLVRLHHGNESKISFKQKK